MTEIEGKYLTRRQKQKNRAKEWFVDILIGGVLAIVLTGIILGISVSILLITPEAHAEQIENNTFYCNQIAEGKAQVAPEDREEVLAYCSNV